MAETCRARLDGALARIATHESALALAREALQAATWDLNEHDEEYHHRTRSGTMRLITETQMAIDGELAQGKAIPAS